MFLSDVLQVTKICSIYFIAECQLGDKNALWTYISPSAMYTVTWTQEIYPASSSVYSDVTGVLGRDVVSVLNVSVSRRSRDIFWNVSSRDSRLGLEDITSRSRSRDLTSCGHPWYLASGRTLTNSRKRLFKQKPTAAVKRSVCLVIALSL